MSIMHGTEFPYEEFLKVFNLDVKELDLVELKLTLEARQVILELTEAKFDNEVGRVVNKETRLAYTLKDSEDLCAYIAKAYKLDTEYMSGLEINVKINEFAYLCPRYF